ncbi:hypothetical protein RQM65_05260 [Pricia sp. S334]|uniref:Uncharacterized protein n=1 Tax=Pricia mediterranea TaxID=3076079 RepID=A0ABU3L2U3_9FLAO|nr:hypothetical protein [Pricia sp. S334]MDT7828071.1 hypothetical protein [Pricia sp. S334]
MKWIIPFTLLVLLTCNTFAQTPEKVSYQAVIRDNNNKLLTNSKVNLNIILRQGSPDGYIAYQENHQARTNVNGLVSLQIGEGNKEVGEFSGIDWSQGPYFIETQLDVKNTQDFSVTGVSEMLSVPYALHAKSADSFTGDGNELAFDKWDKDITDDFSGSFNDLSEVPDLYTKNQVDSLVINLDGGDGIVQSLNLEDEKLSISGGNSISFNNWDTNAADDFSGSFKDLSEVPNLYTKSQVDSLFVNIAGGDGIVQSLNLEGKNLSISGGNVISFDNWDTNATDDFDGVYSKLIGTPDVYTKTELYTKNEIDNLVSGIEGRAGSTSQNLSLDATELSISGGNTIFFDNWDTDVSDDFSGNYNDLQNQPSLFSGNYSDLKNAPALFSGKFNDLAGVPNIYTKNQVDSLVLNLDDGDGIMQSLNLEGEELSISGGNSIYFDNWDTDASDDFDGAYSNLTGTPDIYTKTELYTKTEVDNLVSGIEGGGGSTSQNLSLDANELSISGGNTISFNNWDTDASNDFDGEYTSLNGAPKVYTQDEVNAIKAEILLYVKDNYSPKASIVSFSSSRNVLSNDVGNTLACTTSATLTINTEFTGMKVGDIINLEVHGTTLTVNGATGVIINGNSGGIISIGNNSAYTGGLIRKLDNNSYIVL